MAGPERDDEVSEWLLAEDSRRSTPDPVDEKRRQHQPPPPTPTPLPKLQLAVLLFFQLAEPITSQCIYPFVNQVGATFSVDL